MAGGHPHGHVESGSRGLSGAAFDRMPLLSARVLPLRPSRPLHRGIEWASPPQRSRRPPVVASEEVISEFNTNASEGHRTPCELAIGSESFHRLVLIRGALSRATNDGARPVDDFWVVFNGPRGTQEGAGGGGGKASHACGVTLPR
jgi:hypothetical protein